jgi:MacB-like periplasmic core domain
MFDTPRQVYIFLEDLKQPNSDSGELSEDDYALLAQDSSVFTSIGLSTGETQRLASWGTSSQRVRTNRISLSLFRTFGTELLIGNIPDDWDQVGRDQAIVSCGIWKSMLAGTPQAVGTALNLDGRSYIISGVLPCNFQIGFYLHPEVILPFRSSPRSPDAAVRNLLVFGHLADSVSIATARSQLEALSGRIVKQPDELLRFRATRIRDHNASLGRGIAPIPVPEPMPIRAVEPEQIR